MSCNAATISKMSEHNISTARPHMMASVRRSPRPNNSQQSRRNRPQFTHSSKIRTRSCREALRLYLLVKPQFLIRLFLFAVVTICTVSLAVKLHATVVSQNSFSSYVASRVLFQQPPQALQLHAPKVLPSSSINNDIFNPVKPRVVGYYWPGNYDDVDAEEDSGPQRAKNYWEASRSTSLSLGFDQLDANMIRPLTDRSIFVSTESMKAQIHLEASKDYENNMRDDSEPGDCEAQYEWQRTSQPTCNALHEQALWEMRVPRGSRVKFLANGYWRDVWMLRDWDWEPLALKTIRFMHDYADRNFDRHRRDAVAMERMTSSPNVVDIYSFW